jgi:asparagine synthase (glutamine-hydrolysing)
MSGICGWIAIAGGVPAPEHTLAAMSEPMTRFDASVVRSLAGASWGLAAAALGGRASAARRDGCSAVVWGVLDCGHEIGDAAASSADLVLDRYRAAGADCFASFKGSAAIALVDENERTAYLATDRIGAHPIIHTMLGGVLVFASTADAIRRYPGAGAEVDWQSVYNYVHFHVVPGPATAFRGEVRLMPGEYVAYRAGAVRTHTYWRMQYVENDPASFEDLRAAFRPLLAESVRRHANGAGTTGAFLSGGTDSSTVAGLLGQVTGTAAPTFSIGFDASGYDEMEYARIAARRFSTDHHEYYVTPADIVEAIPKLAEIYDQPFGNSSAVPTYFCARLAKSSGMALLLGGDGGDELFGGNERYATHHMFSLYEKLPQPLRRGMIEPLAKAMPASRALLPLRWFRRAVELAATPMPDRLDAYNLLLQFGPQNVFAPEVLMQVDPSRPTQLMRESFSLCDAPSLINRMLAFDMRFTIADSDLPKVVRSCELAGIPVSFPLLDDEVMAFSARLAPLMKLKGTRLRYFFKEALRGFLPEEIIAKKKHGFGLPFGAWIKQHRPLETLVNDSLSDLKRRRIVLPGLIDQLLADRIAEAPGYYGTMAWVLMMLEGWFKRHVDATSASRLAA